MVDFSQLQTPNYLATIQGGFQAGQQQARQRQRQNVLATYGQDPEGARNALIGMGDLETAGQLQGYENDQTLARQRAQQQQWQGQQQQRQQKVWGQEDQDRVRGLLVDEARALRMMPQDQRAGAYNTRAAPMLAELGFPPEAIAQALEGGLTDEELDAFVVQMGGEIEQQQPRYFQTGQGVVAIGPDGQATMAYEDPLADLERQLLESQITSQRALGTQRQAQAARAARPPAVKSSGSSGSGGLSSMSTADLLKALKNAD